VGQVATAALLLLTLVTSVVAFGRLRSAPGERPASLPAVVATPSSEAALQTVFTTILPAALIPTAPGGRTFDFWHAVLEPGERVPIAGQSPGPQITHVVSGELTIQADGPLQLFRGTNIASGAGTVPSGTAVVLHAGDTAVYPYETAAEYANLGSTPVQVVGGQLSVGGVPGAAASLTFLDYREKYPLPALPPGPVQATLVRATLPSKGLVPAPPAGSLVMEVGAVEEVSIGENSDGSLRNISPSEATIYVLTLTPLGADSETPATGTPAVSEVTADTLVVAPVAANMVPRTSPFTWSFAHFTLPANTPPVHLVGATWDAAIEACCPGLSFEYVVDGTYTVLPEGPVQILRTNGNGTPETGKAGVEIVLGPGDSLISPSEASFEASNAGATPMELLTAVLTNRWSTTNEIPAAWVEHDEDFAYDLSPGDEPTTLRLRRATLAPQTSLPPLPNTVGLVAVTLNAEASLGKQMDGGLRNINDAPVTAYILTLEPTAEGGAAAAATPGS
jgi:hypothetical protein